MNNFRYRTDISPVRGFGAREKVRTVVLGAGQMGAQFAVQDPATIDGYARYTERRWVAALHDGRWTWSDVGEPFDFEDTARYTARKKRDRLDRDLVLRYAHALTGAHVERTDLYGRVLLNQ